MFVCVVIQLHEPNLLDLSSNLKHIYDHWYLLQSIKVPFVDRESLLNRTSFDDLNLSAISFCASKGRTLCFVMNSWNSERTVSASDLRFCWMIELLEFVAESSKEFNLSRNNSIAQVDTIVRWIKACISVQLWLEIQFVPNWLVFELSIVWEHPSHVDPQTREQLPRKVCYIEHIMTLLSYILPVKLMHLLQL